MMYFFFDDTATTEIYTLSLHDALPISLGVGRHLLGPLHGEGCRLGGGRVMDGSETAVVAPDRIRPVLDWSRTLDRKSTRLNSSHANISYAVFCLKKKHVSSSDYILIQT